jgi:hypothetical protein
MSKSQKIPWRLLLKKAAGMEYFSTFGGTQTKPLVPDRRCGCYGEQGSAFVLSLIVMAIVAILGSVGINTSRSDNRSALVYRHGSEGFYAGESGLQQGRRNLNAKSFDSLIALPGMMTQASNFTWPSCYGDGETEWQRVENPKVLYQPFLSSDPVIGRSHSKLPGQYGTSARTGAAIGGISNAVLETSRLSLRAEGFSENETGRVESRMEEWIISYLPVQP